MKPSAFVLAAVLILPFLGGPGALAQGMRPDRTGAASLLDLEDAELIHHAWDLVHPDSVAPEGEYQILVPIRPTPLDSADPADRPSAYLIRNGTSEGSMPLEEWEEARRQSRRDHALSVEGESGGAEDRNIPLLWKGLRLDAETLLAWMQWRPGFEFEMGTAMHAVPSSKPQYQERIGLSWDQKIFRHGLVGASLSRSVYGGGLIRKAESPGPSVSGDARSPFWSDAYWGWSLSAGVPGVKYTVSLADRPLPEYFWLEAASDSLIAHRAEGRIVTQWTGESLRRPGNLAHRVDFRLAHLGYALIVDGDAYGGILQTAELRDLPAFFGRWGMGLTAAPGAAAATRIWLEIPDITLLLERPSAYPTRFQLGLFRLEADYRNKKSFRAGASIVLRVENPVMNYPGDGP